jgi:hypothetical protein
VFSYAKKRVLRKSKIDPVRNATRFHKLFPPV